MRDHPHVRANTDLAFASALLVAVQQGLLGLLVAEGPVRDPASRLGFDADATALVLNVLRARGIVARGPQGWRTAGWLAGLHASRGLSAEALAGVFDGLPELLRTGGTSEAWRAYRPADVAMLAAMFEGPAKELARALPPPAGRVLDVGAGSAVWGLAMLDGRSEVLALDEAHVLDAARDRAKRLGAADRLTCHAGTIESTDFRTLPSARVVCANVLHLFRAPQARRNLVAIAEAVRPGGDLVIVDALFEDRISARTRTSYALQLRLRQAAGTVYSASDVAAWMTEAGLRPEPAIQLSTDVGLAAVRGVRDAAV